MSGKDKGENKGTQGNESIGKKKEKRKGWENEKVGKRKSGKEKR